MAKKPLEPYNPFSFRNRLPQATVVMPYKNSSQIVIGDRCSDYKKQWVTTNGQAMPVHKLGTSQANSGIIAAQAKWMHRRQAA